MELYFDYYTPADLTGYAREALADRQENEFTLSRFLPNREIDDLDYRFVAGGAGLAEAATFRAYDTPAPFGKRTGRRRVSGELPPISRQLRLSEYDRLRRRASANQAITNALEDDAETLVRQIAARIELARGEALATGKVAINENGVVAEADFGRAGNHTVVAGTVWSDTATATVLSDYVAWNDTYKATNGVAPGVSVTSQQVVRLMQRNAEVIAAIAGSAAGRTRVSMAELNELLQSEGLAPVEVNDAQVSVNGVAKRVIDADKFVMLPAPGSESELGATLWGTTSEALEADYGIEDSEAPGIVAGVYKSNDPVALYTKAAGISLPVLANPDLSFAADVL